MRFALLLLAVFVCVSCDKATPPPPPPPKKAAPPPEPKVELPAAPALPEAAKGLPALVASEDNPTTAEKAALGNVLFFDKRLSKDDSMACAQCHLLDKALSSGAALDAKVGGEVNTRNAPTMFNLGYHTTWYWDGRMATLEAVSNAAWKGQLGAEPAAVATKLNAIPTYKALFNRAFATKDGATAENVPQALAAWLRSLTTGNSAFDRYAAGDLKAMSKQQLTGWKVFQKSGCVVCHLPPLFTDNDFHAIGVNDDPGRMNATKDEKDVGKFKTPSLRNVALTGPYFHDGKTVKLADAIAFMAKGGGKVKVKDPKLKKVKLSKKDVVALEAFLTSLSGESTWPTEPTLP